MGLWSLLQSGTKGSESLWGHPMGAGSEPLQRGLERLFHEVMKVKKSWCSGDPTMLEMLNFERKLGFSRQAICSHKVDLP